ncbi:histone acetylation protein-domain-containing protein [Desarmillaria tabescens]|uniref:histone acetyltransferase n=1 Tax=Armillaria tabescens TaxID=1929756 RepID=A0AA39NFN4_ARMTA|nr:histone acetylation protein-domain-containing protein [Desarmillaria tabescens]KAK0464659.1 histone acetylation protein-domain-containing protein [Desarmillaria tabescens]
MVQTGFNGLIALIVECFFARRVYICAVFNSEAKHHAHSLPVSKNTFIAAIIVTLSCFHFIFTLKSLRLGSMGEFQQLIWVTSAGNGSLAAADILIAASLCFYLYRSRTGYESVATGLVSSLIGIGTVITAENVELPRFTSGAIIKQIVHVSFTLPSGFNKERSGSSSNSSREMGKATISCATQGQHSDVHYYKNRRRRYILILVRFLADRKRVFGPAVVFCSVVYVRMEAPENAFNSASNSWTHLTFSIAITMSVNLLRNALLDGLKDLPGTREFHVHVLVSSPRKHADLYPYALPRPRSYLQDILILLSEQKTPDLQRIMVSGIEACVYNIPTTSCAILYVSKVDSTGQAYSPSPTSALVRSLLLFYADPATRPIEAQHLWIHLFARAQNQYLFPNSSEFVGKRPLSDVRLCGWWKGIFTGVATELDARSQSKAVIRLNYVLPGYSELEAENSLKATSPSSSPSSPPHLLRWTYGHPYSQQDIPLPCPKSEVMNLGHYIPWFDDDPKSRFIDEIAYTTENGRVKSPARKRTRTNSRLDSAKKQSEEDGEDVQTSAKKDDRKDERPSGELGIVSPDEFWERMSFRQECVAGAVTGFFTLGVTFPHPASSNFSMHSSISPLAPQPGQVSSQINKRIMTSLHTAVDFSSTDFATRATESLEGAIRGLCEGISSIPTPIIQVPRPIRATDRSKSERRTPEPSSLLAPPPPSTPPPRMANGTRIVPDISPNPFPEPEPSLETYNSHIYGSMCVSNPDRPSKKAEAAAGVKQGAGNLADAPQVTVLTVRKKKKRTE